MLTTTTGSAIVGAAQNGSLILDPVSALSLAFDERVATVVAITQTTGNYRIPRVLADPQAAWVREGEEITASDPNLDEVLITPSKVAGLTIVSREMANDSNPAAADAVGDGLARDITRKVDAAFVGDLAAPAPKGLASLDDVSTVDLEAGRPWENTDPFAEAISMAQGVGASLTAFIVSPADALAMATVKKGTGSNEPLLGNDPTQPTTRTILGLPLLVARDLAAGSIYGVDATRNFTVVREDVSVVSDASVYFTSDRVAVRGTMRVGFGFPQEPAVVRITRTA